MSLAVWRLYCLSVVLTLGYSEHMSVLDLVEEIRSGARSREAQEELYPLVREALLSRIERRLQSRLRSRVDAEDVLHESFVRAMAALDLFEPRSEQAFFAWVFTIAKNLMLDQSKRRSVGAVHLVGGSQQAGPRLSQVQGRERRAESMLQGTDAVASLLKRLKESEAEIIRLRKMEGLSFEEIAERYGKTPQAVQRSFSRAWTKLCELVDEGP